MSYADQIRTENDAKVMRDLVANGIGENKSIADDANEKSTDAQNRVNNIITNQNGQTPVEVIDSRYDSVNNITYNNLGARLNAHSSSLAEKANRTELQQLSLSYKESYATLSDLQTAYPSGDTHNHAVLADGMIYTYVNSTWTNTQVQANGTGIADNSLTTAKYVNESITTEKIKYVDVEKINYNLLREPFFTKLIAEDSDYLSKFQVDSNGNLLNIATSSSIYEFNSIPITFPDEFELKFTITVDKTTENGQLNGFSNADKTSRFIFGYEPAHNAFEVYRGSFKVLDADTNFSNGDYTFTFTKSSDGTAILRITGSGYDKTFNMDDYFTFDISLYSIIRLQIKIPALGNALRELSLEKKEIITDFDKTGLKTYSTQGQQSGKNVHVYQFGGQGNDWCFVRTPSNYDSNREKPYPFVICNHGNGWVMDGSLTKASWTKRTMYVPLDDSDYVSNPTQYNGTSDSSLWYSNPTIEALLNAGYIVCGCENYGDNLYGNDNCRQACADFYQHMIKNYNVEEKCYMIGASNGAMTSLNAMYLLGGVARVKAMILQYPLTCLWRHYTNYSTHQSAIESAYGIAAGLTEAQFEKATRTHDPEKVCTITGVNGVSRFKTMPMPPIKFWYSLGDTVTVASNNSLALIQLLEDSNCINENVVATGDHGDYSHFDPTAYVNWFEKWR